MVFLGVISSFDPLKESAEQALQGLAEKVLKDDALPIAIQLCKEVGIRTTHVMTGPDWASWSCELQEAVQRFTVFAHHTPVQNRRPVQVL